MNIRSFLLILVIICSSAVSYSQEQNSGQKDLNESKAQKEGMKTLFGNSGGKIRHGGYGAVMLGYTSVSGQNAFIAGASGGWLIDHRFTLGLSGTGFVSNINQIDQAQPSIDNFSLAGGYGGLLVELIVAPFDPVHISFPVVIGGGGATVIEPHNYYENNEHVPHSAFFVIEPGIDIEFNMVNFFRIALCGTYRYTSNLSIDYYTINGIKDFHVPDNALRGFNLALKLKFGKF